MFSEIWSFGPLSLQKSCDYGPFYGTRGSFLAQLKKLGGQNCIVFVREPKLLR